MIAAGTRKLHHLGRGGDAPILCLDALTDGVELRIDLGCIGDRVFVNNASFGAWPTVVHPYRDDKAVTALQLLPDLQPPKRPAPHRPRPGRGR